MRHATVAAALDEAARVAPDAPFLHYGDETVTFRQMDEVSDRVAAALLARGVGHGDRIALAALNQPEWLYTYFGAQKVGAAVVTLNVRYRERELDHMLNQSGARMLVCLARLPEFDFGAFLASFRDRVRGVEDYVFIGAGGFPGSLSFDELATASVDTEALAAAEARVRPEDPAVILYTSGTTGRPKGAVITGRSILASAAAQAEHFGITASDVSLGNLPLNHVGGITCTITAALLSHSSVVLLRSFTPEAALAAIERHRATVFGGVPTMYVMTLGHPDFARYDVSSLRYCIAGGSNVEPALCERIRAAFPNARVLNLYGLSESSGACVLSRLDDDVATVARSVGVVVGGFEGRVVGPDGAPVPAGEVGELQIRGDCVAAGYWKMPEETAQAFLPDGWLATGDMAAMEPDGHIVLKGRKKEMYIQGGYNVYPVEVENVLAGHPKVALAAGIGVPDPVLGEVGRFYIVPRPGGPPPTPEELTAYCGERLADYKVPRQFVIADELPLTPAGKVHKAALRERYAAEAVSS